MSNKKSVPADEDVFESVGFIARMLHDALSELGLDKKIEDVVHSIPDARSRLEYISKISGESAEKVIIQVENGKVTQLKLAARAAEIEQKLKDDPVQAVATGGVLEFIEDVRASSETTDEMLTEILMAQSFHDLTSQVVQKVTTLAANLEQELIKLLVEITPDEKREQLASQELNGPVIDGTADEVVTSQDQVDDLLESLGF